MRIFALHEGPHARNSLRRIQFGTAILILLSTVAYSQDDAVFSTDVNVVTVLATVRDKNGRIVQGLTKEDFTLYENGRPQSIQYFSQESDLPLTVGLLVDVSPSQTEVLEEQRTASYQFVEQLLRPDKGSGLHYSV